MMEQKTLDPAPAAKDQPDVKPPQDSGPAQPKPRSKAVPLIIIAVLGVVGIYVSRLYIEAKGRPRCGRRHVAGV